MDSIKKGLEKVAENEKKGIKDLTGVRDHAKAEVHGVKDAARSMADDAMSSHKAQREAIKGKKIEHEEKLKEVGKTIESGVEKLKELKKSE